VTDHRSIVLVVIGVGVGLIGLALWAVILL
jgi:hypothetical protein